MNGKLSITLIIFGKQHPVMRTQSLKTDSNGFLYSQHWDFLVYVLATVLHRRQSLWYCRSRQTPAYTLSKSTSSYCSFPESIFCLLKICKLVCYIRQVAEVLLVIHDQEWAALSLDSNIHWPSSTCPFVTANETESLYKGHTEKYKIYSS